MNTSKYDTKLLAFQPLVLQIFLKFGQNFLECMQLINLDKN